MGPLRQKDGRSQDYTFAEIVGIAAVVEAVAGFGLGVERLGPIADQLFVLVAKATEPGREAGILFLGTQSVTWNTEVPRVVESCMFMIPLGPVIARIRQRIAAGNPPEVPPVQYDLPMPGQRVVGLTRK